MSQLDINTVFNGAPAQQREGAAEGATSSGRRRGRKTSAEHPHAPVHMSRRPQGIQPAVLMLKAASRPRLLMMAATSTGPAPAAGCAEGEAHWVSLAASMHWVSVTGCVH